MCVGDDSALARASVGVYLTVVKCDDCAVVSCDDRAPCLAVGGGDVYCQILESKASRLNVEGRAVSRVDVAGDGEVISFNGDVFVCILGYTRGIGSL